MEQFPLLTISGSRLSSFALKGVPDLTRSLHTTSLPDCFLTELQSYEPLRQNCTIYRPWYSPYSYFECMDKHSQEEDSCCFPDMHGGNNRKVPADIGQAAEIPNSVSSSSGSQERAYPQDSRSNRKARTATEGKDGITSQDILLASKWRPLHQNGYKCMACCRMFPTLHSLKTHIKCGSKEGFSCKVYYHKLKALWEKEQKCRLNAYRAGSGGSNSSSSTKHNCYQTSPL